MTSHLRAITSEVLRWSILLAALPALTACGSTGPSVELRDDIEAHRSLWEDRAFRDHGYTLERVCFCGPEVTRPVRVEVRRGAVARVVEPGTGELVDPALWHLYPTVDGVFAVLLDAVSRGAAEVELEWDPELDFPSRVSIDYDRQVADEELGFRIRDLAPLE